jgi:hypothetical protein
MEASHREEEAGEVGTTRWGDTVASGKGEEEEEAL